MIKLLTFLIIFFTGIQLYVIPLSKISNIISIEAIRQIIFLYLFVILVVAYSFSLYKLLLKTLVDNNMFLLLYLSISLIGVLYSSSYLYGLVDVMKISYVIGSSFIFNKFFSIYGYEKSSELIDIFIIIAFLTFLFQAAFNIISGNYISPDTGGFLIPGKSGRAIGSMFCSIISIYFFVNYLDKERKIYLILFVLSFLLTILSFTRIAIFGFFVAFLMVNVFYKRFRYFLLVSIILVLLLYPLANNLIKESFIGIENLEDLAKLDLSNIIYSIRLTGREILWAQALNGFLKNPLFGNGTGSANYSIKLVTENAIEQVHNDYLKILSDLGLIGLFLYLGIYFQILKSSKKIYVCNRLKLKKMYILLISTLTQLLIFSFTDNVISYAPYLMVYLFLFYSNLFYADHDLKFNKL